MSRPSTWTSCATAQDVRAAYGAAGPAAMPAVVLADPVLVITGTEDRYLDHIRLERHYLPSVRYHEIDNAGHLVMWEQPATTNRLIEAFLAEMAREQREA
jgi:pimeloyl-ACP methyl ester carboxylesterase